VLLVEDEDSLRGLVRKFLEKCGYVVLEAKDGQSGLRISNMFPGVIHVLLTDVVMPGMSGDAGRSRGLVRNQGAFHVGLCCGR